MATRAHYNFAQFSNDSKQQNQGKKTLSISIQMVLFGMSLSTLALADDFNYEIATISQAEIDFAMSRAAPTAYKPTQKSPTAKLAPTEPTLTDYNMALQVESESSLFAPSDFNAHTNSNPISTAKPKSSALINTQNQPTKQEDAWQSTTDYTIAPQLIGAIDNGAFDNDAFDKQRIVTTAPNTAPAIFQNNPYVANLRYLSAAGNKQASLATLSSLYKSHSKGRYCQGSWYLPSGDTPSNDALQQSLVAAGVEPSHAHYSGSYAYADYGYYDNQEYAELVGDVVVYQNGQKVLADKVTLNPKTRAMNAVGQVLFSDDRLDNGSPESGSSLGNGLIGVSNRVRFDGKDTTVADDIAFASRQLNAHGYAEQLIRQNNRYLMDNAMFSTCPPDDRKWYINASSITLDQQSGRGIAKNTTLKIKDTPVLYLPYFNFPIDSRRATGFLLPSVGFNSNDGVRVTTPYYFNLAPNYDATITPTIFSNRNPMLTGGFRYLTSDFGSGRIEGAYLAKDKQYANKDRSHLFFDHLWQSKVIDNLSAYATYRHVSDNQYLSDFDTLGLSNNPLNLPRRAGVSYNNDYLRADLRAETFQTLDATDIYGNVITDKDKPYSRLPQLSLDYVVPSEWLGRFKQVNIAGTSQSAYFKKSINDGSAPETSGVRMYNQLSASIPFARAWGYITPKASLAHLYTSYDEDSQTSQNLDKNSASDAVFVPQLSLDAGLYFYKSGAPFGLYKDLGGYQLLSPRIKYLYSPHKNQSNMPNFETVLASMTYEQLLSDTWFLGYDRIMDMHAITPALNYRYIDSAGQTRIDASIAEQIYLEDSQVYLDKQLTHQSSSGLAWQASIQPWQNLWFDTSGSFTPNYNINAFIGSLRYIPSANQLYNFGVIERKNNEALGQFALSALTASAIFPISERWQVVGSAQFDTDRSQFMDALVGVNYEDCCIGFSVYGRHYRNDLNPSAKPTQAVMAELRLTGITGRGSLFRLLNQKVLGFENVSWQR